MKASFHALLAKHWRRHQRALDKYNQVNRLGDYPAWYNFIAPPLANLLLDAGKHKKYELHGPFGQNARIEIKLLDEDGPVRNIHVVPVSVREMRIGIIDYSAATAKNPAGNVVEIDYMTPAELLAFAALPKRRQIRAKKLRRRKKPQRV